MQNDFERMSVPGNACVGMGLTLQMQSILQSLKFGGFLSLLGHDSEQHAGDFNDMKC